MVAYGFHIRQVRRKAIGFLLAGMLLLIVATLVALLARSVPTAAAADGLATVDAYVNRLTVTNIVDGYEPYDASAGRGNDTGPSNLIVRTFDSVAYGIEYVVTPTEGTGTEYYADARIGFRAVLPFPSDKAEFDIESMPWVDTTAGYQPTVVTETIDGVTCQVLTCYRVLHGTDSIPVVIPGTSTVEFRIKVGAMKNAEELSVDLWAWVDGAANDRRQSIYGNPYGKHAVTDTVTVTAALAYNVAIYGGTDPSGVGPYDFSTGNSRAPNKDIGTVYGRMYSFGVNLQMRNTNVPKGLKGLELPEGPITFDIALSSTYRPTEGTTVGSTFDNIENEGFMPRLWSMTEFTISGQRNDGRHIDINGCWRDFPMHASPKGTHPAAGSTVGSMTTWESGQWNAVQEGNVLHVTVSGYELNMDWQPVADWGDSQNTVKYNKATFVFSSSTMFIIQPFYNAIQETYRIDDPTYICTVHPSIAGDLIMSVRDYNLMATGISGDSLPEAPSDTSNQPVSSDDAVNPNMGLRLPGSYNTRCQYTYIGNTDALELGTDHNAANVGNYSNGMDTAFIDSQVMTMFGSINYAMGERDNLTVMRADFCKFDDKLLTIDPTAAIGYSSDGDREPTAHIWYVAKPDKTGWVDDAELLAGSVRTGNFVFFPTYQDLVDNGYVCVGILHEVRYAEEDEKAALNRMDTRIAIPVTVSDDVTHIGDVAMICLESMHWRRYTLASAVAEDLGKSVATLTRDDYQQWVTSSSAPSVTNRSNDPHGILNRPSNYRAPNLYIKVTYNADGTTSGHSGGYCYGDSLLLIGEKASVVKSVAQSDDGGTSPKKVFDIDYDQRVVDYQLAVNVTAIAGVGESLPTTLTVRDTIPAHLRYMDGSARYGGTYTEHTPEAGTVIGGQVLVPSVTAVAGGTQLAFTIENFTPGTTGIIRYSAQIGTPGDEENDVVNNEQLTNVVTIRSTYDGRIPDETLGNMDSATIRISKLRSQSLAIIPIPIINEVSSPVSFQSVIGNFGSTDTAEFGITLLPFNEGTGGSAFHGTYVLSSVVVSQVGTSDLSRTRAFFTTDMGLRTTDIKDTKPADVLDNTSGQWVEATVNVTTGNVTIPSSLNPANITAYALYDPLLPAGTSVRGLMTLTPNGNKAGDMYRAQLADGDNEVSAKLYVASRSVSGLLFYDVDKDGRRTSADSLVANQPVRLVWGDTGEVVTNLEGATCSTTTDASGAYAFQALPTSVVSSVDRGMSVVFGQTADTPAWSAGYACLATEKDKATVSDSEDSDADGIAITGSTQRMVVSGISMPPVESLLSSTYVSAHNDAGLVQKSGSIRLEAEKVLDGRPVVAGEFSFVLKGAGDTVVATGTNDGDGHILFPRINYDAFGTIGDASTSNIGNHTYTMSEVAGNDGSIVYDHTTYPVTVSVTVGQGDTLGVSADYGLAAGAVPTFTNALRNEVDMPLSGSTGTARLVLVATCLSCGATWMFVSSERQKQTR